MNDCSQTKQHGFADRLGQSLAGSAAWLALAIGCTFPCPLSAQPLPYELSRPSNGFGPEGTRLFRSLLGSFGIYAIADVRDFPPDDFRSLIVIINEFPSDRVERRQIQQYAARVLQQGGAVLILTEQAGDLSECFPEPTGLFVDEGKVFSTDADRCFEAFPGCPYPVARGTGHPGLIPLVRLMERSATNHPAALTLTRPSRYAPAIMAGFSQDCRIGIPPRRLAENQGLLVIGDGHVFDQPFRCLILSDTSLFMNQMLAASDPKEYRPQNLSLACSMIRWLQGPEQRGYCLFLEHGVPRRRFDPLPSLSPPVPPLPNPLDPRLQSRLTDYLNTALARLEDNDIPTRAILGEPDNELRRANLLRTLLIGFAVIGLSWAILRLWGNRHHPHRPQPSASTTSGDQQPLPDHMQAMIRELFRNAGWSDWNQRPKSLPPVNIQGPQAKRLLQDLQRLWSLDREPTAKRLPSVKELETMIVNAWAAAEAGRWRFIPSGGNG